MINIVYNIVMHFMSADEDNTVFRESWVLINIQDMKTKLTGLPRGVTLRLLLLLDFHFNGKTLSVL